jgi:hypothetical protein
VDHKPKFTLDSGERYFCLGSCFARNIEEHLIYAGETVLSKRIVSPKGEYPYRTNGFVNQFTTYSMLQEVEWLFKAPDPLDTCFVETANGWIDMHLFGNELSLERVRERRRYLLQDYFSRLRDSTVVLLTLGLNEVWRDGHTGMNINVAPSVWTVRRYSERFTLHVTDVAENLDALEQLRSRLKALRPELRIIITVSPVPMTETFQGIDVALANNLSKTVLRSAAEAFHRRHDDVDYFPSYEMVALAPRSFSYYPDFVHVNDSVVNIIVTRFISAYRGKLIAPPEGYVERDYLNANPDVEARVRNGELVCGYEHWLSIGRKEGRRMVP